MAFIDVDQFPGLDLRKSPDEAACIDLLNVDLDVRGRIRSRDGYTLFENGVAITGTVSGMAPVYSTAGDRLLVSLSDIIYAFSTDYLAVAPYSSTDNRFENAYSFARSPASDAVYVGNANSSGASIGRLLPGTGFQISGGGGYTFTGTAPTGKFVATWPFSGGNRLVSAHRWNTTAGDNGSTVQFSDAGSSVAWTSTSYVDLFPNDGETINGLCVWRDQLFAFKASRFFVFYGESVDSSGNPIFNYRPVDVGIGNAAPRGVAVGSDGVYFVNSRGVYRTTGGGPQLVSGAIDPVFTNTVGSFFASSALNHAQISKCVLSVANERLWFSYPSGSATANDRTFVMDLATGEWTLWDLAVPAMTTWRSLSGREEVFFGIGASGPYRFGPAYTTDNGTNITSRYRAGFRHIADGADARVREILLHGTGTVTVKTAVDWGSLDTGASVALGTSPAIAEGRYRGSVGASLRGGQFSWQVSSTSPWSLQRVQLNVPDARTR